MATGTKQDGQGEGREAQERAPCTLHINDRDASQSMTVAVRVHSVLSTRG